MTRRTFPQGIGTPDGGTRSSAVQRHSVSVVIPCRNEAVRIQELLEAVRRQDTTICDVLVIDGGSTDGTPLLVEQCALQHPGFPLRCLFAPGLGIAELLNRAIRTARGDLIVRLDGHSLPPPDYVRRAVETLIETDAGVVGGVWTIAPGGRTRTAEAIAMAVAHPLGAGDAVYRTHRLGHGRTLVDTVPFGCFRKSSWEAIGGFNEDLWTNEDYEFNYRMRASGRPVVLEPAVCCTYFARTNLSELAAQYFRYGWWKAAMLRAYPRSLRWRQALPASLVPTLGLLSILSFVWPPVAVPLVVLVGLYLMVVTGGTLQIAGRRRRGDLLAPLAAVLTTVHWSWSAGVSVNFLTGGRWPSWRAKLTPTPARDGRRGVSGVSLVLALCVICVLALVVPPGVATLINRSRIERARQEVTALAERFKSASASSGLPGNLSADLLGGEGRVPEPLDGSEWTAGRIAASRPFAAPAPEPDPWGNRYLVNAGPLSDAAPAPVWVLSAGPNGVIETPYRASSTSSGLGGDDIGARVR